MTTIITKYTTTAGRKPAVSNLAVGELAVNLVDKELYTRNNTSKIIQLTERENGKLLGNALTGAVAINRSEANYFWGTMTAACTFTLNDGGKSGTSLTLVLTTGGFAPTFTGVTWMNDSTPLATNGTYMMGLFFMNSKWYGVLVQ